MVMITLPNSYDTGMCHNCEVGLKVNDKQSSFCSSICAIKYCKRSSTQFYSHMVSTKVPMRKPGYRYNNNIGVWEKINEKSMGEKQDPIDINIFRSKSPKPGQSSLSQFLSGKSEGLKNGRFEYDNTDIPIEASLFKTPRKTLKERNRFKMQSFVSSSTTPVIIKNNENGAEEEPKISPCCGISNEKEHMHIFKKAKIPLREWGKSELGFTHVKIPGKTRFEERDLKTVPGFAEWRYENKAYNQQRIIHSIIGLFEKGFNTVILEAPTGIGKSIIAYATAHNLSSPFYILTQFNTLQDQYLRDFHKPDNNLFLYDIRGRRHFDCGLQYNWYRCVSCEDDWINVTVPISTICKTCGDEMESIEPERYETYLDVKADEAPCVYNPDFMGSKNVISEGTGDVTREHKCPVRAQGLCTYFRQRDTALQSSPTVTNPAYLLSLSKASDEMVPTRDIAIWDEAHMLPDILISHFSFSISPSQWTRWGMKMSQWPIRADNLHTIEVSRAGTYSETLYDEVNERQTYRQKKLTKGGHYTVPGGLLFSDWIQVEESLGEVVVSGPMIELYHSMERMHKIYTEHLAKSREPKEQNDILKKRQSIKNAMESVKEVIDNFDRGFVISKQIHGRGAPQAVFKPLEVKDKAGQLFEKISDKRILMSATIRDAEVLTMDLGLNMDTTAYIEVTQSPFPVNNRPIYIETRHGSLAYKFLSKPNSPNLANVLDRVCEIINEQTIEGGKRGLVLPYTKKMLRAIVEHWEKFQGRDCDPVNQYSMESGTLVWAHDYKTAVKYFIESDEPLVLMSTVNAGLDFPGDLCEYLVLPKAMNPNIKDAWIDSRMKRFKGHNWYVNKQITEIVQAAGRHVRSVQDVAATYILDANIWKNIRDNHWRYPKWFLESIILNGKEIDFGRNGAIQINNDTGRIRPRTFKTGSGRRSIRG